MEIPDIKPNTSKPVMMKGVDDIHETIAGAKLNKPVIPKKGLSALILPEDVPDIQTYIKSSAADTVQKVLIPKAKEIIMSALASMLHLDGYYSTRNYSGSSISSSSVPRVSYNNLPRSNVEASSFYEDVRFDPLDGENTSEFAKQRAQRVLEYITELYYDRGKITVANLYDVAGLGSFVIPNHYNYGWTTLTRTKIIPSGGGYILQMPYPRPI